MGRFQRAFRRLLGGKQSQDVSPGWNTLYGILQKEWKSADQVWDSFSTSELENIYSTADIIFACINLICRTAAEAPLQLGMPDEEGGFEVVHDHDILSVIKNPNAYYTWEKVEKFILSRLLLTGVSYTIKMRRTAPTMVGQLWPIPSSWVDVGLGSGTELIRAYRLRQSKGEAKEIPPEDMMHIWFSDPSSTYKPLGPLQAALHAYQLDAERENYLVEMLENMKVPGMVIKAPMGLSEPDKQALKHRLHDSAGKGRRGNVVTLEGDVDVTYGEPLKDLDWPGITSLNETRICSAFNVPPILIGARAGLEHATYANYGEARKSFYQETMVAIWIMLAQAYTGSLLRAEGEDELEFRYNLDGIKALQEDATETATRAAALVSGGIVTRNEARIMVGFDEVPDGDVYLLPMTTIEQPIRGSIEEVQTEEPLPVETGEGE